MRQLYKTKNNLLSLVKILLTWTLLTSLFFSCSDSSTEPTDPNNYYPLSVGQYQVYEVREEIYSSGQKVPVVTSWLERDEISSMKTNTNGSSTFIVSRSRRNTTADYWQKVKEYAIEQYPDKLIFNIDNQITVPFIFPVDSKVSWNGNMYNTLDKQDYHYEDINASYQLGDLSFDKALTVVERRDTTSVIDYYLSLKRYALGVGLVYDEQTAYQYCQSSPECIGLDIVDSGSRKTRKILEYGLLQ